ARCLYRSAVQLRKPLHQRQSNSQSTLRTVQQSLSLCEQIKDARQKVGAYTDTRITNAYNTLSVLFQNAEPDLAAGIHVLRRIPQQLCAHLFQQSTVAIEREAL